MTAKAMRSDAEHGRIRVWRLKAEELRTIADGMRDPSARSGLLNAAMNYERLADDAEGRFEPARDAAG
jgi:hypothetical protein